MECGMPPLLELRLWDPLECRPVDGRDVAALMPVDGRTSTDTPPMAQAFGELAPEIMISRS